MVTEKSKANLRVPTSEEARKNGKKGGIASGKSRRTKRTVKECVMALLDVPVPADRCEKYGLEPGTTYAAAMALKGVDGFLDGNPAMARLILELIGESKQELNINGAMPVVIHDDIK